jgi:hypothetical protein
MAIMSELAGSVSRAVEEPSGRLNALIGALTRRRGLFVFACVVFSLGIVFGLSGFLGLGIDPDFLAQLLG